MTIALSLSRPAARPVSLLARVAGALAVTRQRKHLAALDDHLLADIGVTRKEAQTEAARAPWDAPRFWRI